MKSKIKKITDSLKSFGQKAGWIVSVFLFILILFIFAQVSAMVWVYIELMHSKSITMLLFNFINVWGIISEGSITNEIIYKNYSMVKGEIEFLMNAFVAVSSIMMSAMTYISFIRKKNELKKSSCFKKEVVFTDGKEDVEIMCEYFKGANYVSIHSHSFGWLGNEHNAKIREVLTDLANKNKLRLYTSDDVEEVKKRLAICGAKLTDCLGASCSNPMRFSYVLKDNMKYLLYRQKEDETTYVIIVKENIESKYLLDVLSELVG